MRVGTAFVFFLSLIVDLSTCSYASHQEFDWYTPQKKFDVLTVSFADSEGAETFVVSTKSESTALNAITGEVLWVGEYTVGVPRSLVLSSDNSIVVNVIEGEGSVHVSARDSVEGHLHWEKALVRQEGSTYEEIEAIVSPPDFGDSFFLLKLDNQLHSFNEKGEVLWTAESPKDHTIRDVFGQIESKTTVRCIVESADGESYRVAHIDNLGGLTTGDAQTFPSPSFRFTFDAIHYVHKAGSLQFELISAPLEEDLSADFSVVYSQILLPFETVDTNDVILPTPTIVGLTGEAEKFFVLLQQGRTDKVKSHVASVCEIKGKLRMLDEMRIKSGQLIEASNGMTAVSRDTTNTHKYSLFSVRVADRVTGPIRQNIQPKNPSTVYQSVKLGTDRILAISPDYTLAGFARGEKASKKPLWHGRLGEKKDAASCNA